MFKLSVPLTQKLHGLCEAVDADNKPLCLLPETELLRQNLYRRSVAILLRDGKGHNLLCRNRNDSFGFSAHETLPAGMSLEEFCMILLETRWQINCARISPAGVMPPCQENRNAFATVFIARISAAFAQAMPLKQEENLFADKVELASLARREGMLDPFLRIAMMSDALNIM